MNIQQAKELLPIITAFAEGDRIQHRHGSNHEWGDIHDPTFASVLECYRIKPGPREFFGKVDATGHDYQNDTRHFNVTIKGAHGEVPECGELIRLIEVLS